MLDGSRGAGDELEAPWSALCLGALVARTNDKSASECGTGVAAGGGPLVWRTEYGSYSGGGVKMVWKGMRARRHAQLLPRCAMAQWRSPQIRRGQED